VNDMQLVSLGLTLLAIFAAMVGNRKSVEDMRDVLRAESNADLAGLRAESKADLIELRTQSKADIAELRAEFTELRADLTELRAEIRGGFASLETKLLVHELEHRRK